MHRKAWPDIFMTAKNLTCKICAGLSTFAFSAKILKKYDVDYFLCSECGFLQTEEPYWLNESYCKSINISDTGILGRALYLSEIASIILYCFYDTSGKFLDHAGGYGLFTRRMRDIGFDFFWDDKYSENLMARGFEKREVHSRFELVTSFESFEHFPNPITEIETLLKLSDSILFTTDLLPDPVPEPPDWYYYGLEHGQHISFFSVKTFRYIADKYGLNFYTIGNIHLLTKKKLDAGFLGFTLRLRRFGLFRYVSLRRKSLMVQDSQFLQKATGG